ncbi:MAG TPA: hypothetical protein DIW30_04800 [Bacteroidales bacterium]|nr:hypothetical protein [Bacteroidales bacterium]
MTYTYLFLYIYSFCHWQNLLLCKDTEIRVPMQIKSEIITTLPKRIFKEGKKVDYLPVYC